MNKTLELADHLERTPADSGVLVVHDALRMAAAELRRLDALINTPETENFVEGIRLEAAHQEQRWGASHDDGKGPQDWYWLVGHLAGKALMSFVTGDIEKAKHHVITTAAALANWHRKLCGSGTMRPGIAPPEPEKTEEYQQGFKAYQEGRTPCANPYLSTNQFWASGSWARGFRAAALKDTKEHG